MGSFPDARGMQAVYALWDELAAFPAGRADAALAHLFGWLKRWAGADNVTWIGAVRVLRGAAAKGDPFSGWRLRARRTMRPDTRAYRKLMGDYYLTEHYAKAAASRPRERDRARAVFHGGMTGLRMVALSGEFRIYRLRDDWIDFAAFERTEHFELYYRRPGISDRMHAGFPLNADAESILMIDRKRPGARTGRTFSDREKALAEVALRGAREFHRRLFLDQGLLVGATPLTPLQQRIVRELLTGKSGKEIAAATGHRPETMHKYVKTLYARFGVNGRAALMALWLGSS